MLDRKTLLLREIHLLRIKTLQVGHIATQLGQLHEGIDLIREQNGLLFVDALLVGCNLDKEVGARDMTTCIAHLTTIIVVLTLTG